MRESHLLVLALLGPILAACTVLPARPPAFTLTFASDRSGDGEIYLMHPDGRLTNLTKNPAVDWDPAWSPDGTRLAFTTHRDGNAEIYVMNADGSQPTNLTRHPAGDYMPAWSPDGQHIAFVTERDGNQEIYAMNADGSGQHRLTVNDVPQDDRHPAWSPDSTRLAFSGIRHDVESVLVMSADGSGETVLTPWPLKGAGPAWSPNGTHIAFAGSDDTGDEPGLWVMDADGSHPTLVYKTGAWLGSVSWSPDGQWLLFAAWMDGDHELYAVRPDGRDLRRLTHTLAWDDAPSVRPGDPGTHPPAEPARRPPPTLAPHPTPRPGLRYGANLADLSKAYLVRDMGFGWAKGYVDWNGVEVQKGQYDWRDVDNVMEAYAGSGLRVLLRVDKTPDWARPPGTAISHPPTDPGDLADFLRALAARYGQAVDAYEIWNEPNLDYEWGYRQPDPAEYAALLRAAYAALKEADPDCLVVTGGLATTGPIGGPGAVADLDFIQGLYDAGAQGYFDALGTHPYPFGHDPAYHDPWELSFDHAATQHGVMAANGDGDTPLWVTEAGWLLRSPWEPDGESQAVSEAQQAEYLVRAYQRAEAEWPWMGAIFFFNLDFSTVSWYRADDVMRWYAVLHPDRSPRLAYTRLRMMGRGP